MDFRPQKYVPCGTLGLGLIAFFSTRVKHLELHLRLKTLRLV
jgi:hypothetical protein